MSRVVAVASTLGLLAHVFLAAPPAFAVSTCTMTTVDDNEVDKLQVSVGADDSVVLRSAEGTYQISVNGDPFGSCSGNEPTVETVWIEIIGSDAGNETITLLEPSGALSNDAVTVDLGNGTDTSRFDFGGILEVADPSTTDALALGSVSGGPQVARVPGTVGGVRIDNAEVIEVRGGGGDDLVDASAAGTSPYLGVLSTNADDGPATEAPASSGVFFDAGDGDDDLVSGDGNDLFLGGPGSDRVRYTGASSAIAVDLAAGTASGQGSDVLTDVENVGGSSSKDVITGNDLGNELLGGDGDDSLTGGLGNDVVQGNAGDDSVSEGAAVSGADVLSGGDGVDTLNYSARTAPVVVTQDDLPNDGQDDDGDGNASDPGEEMDNVFGFEDVLGVESPVDGVESLVDLAILDIAPGLSAESDVLRLLVRIENQGGKRSPPTQVQVTADGWETGTAAVDEIPVGQLLGVLIPLPIPEGAFGRDAQFHVQVDPSGALGEEDLADNVLDRVVPIPTRPISDAISPLDGAAGPDGSVLPWVLAAVALALLVIVSGFALSVHRRPPHPKPRLQFEEPQIKIPAPAVRNVSAGFSDPGAPDLLMDPNTVLAPGHDYLFWMKLGGISRGATAEKPPTVRPLLVPPSGRTLTVVLFAFDGDLEVTPGATFGRFRLASDDRIVAIEQPGKDRGLPPPPGPEPALFFPIRTPTSSGRFGLRANIYYQHILIQSRRVTAAVDDAPHDFENAINVEMDYSASLALNYEGISQRESHRASLMFNRNDDGAVGLMVYASDGREIACPARIPEGFVAEHIDRARQALRDVAYEPALGDAEPRYRYEVPRPLDDLRRDLVTLATAGSRIYFAIRHQLACAEIDTADPVGKLESILRRPGFVEVVNRDPPSFVLPAALLYDRPLDDALPESEIAICDRFVAAYEARADLAGLACFSEGCSHADDDRVVCPSNFWGYRHDLGFPVTQERQPDGSKATEGARRIEYETEALVDVVVSTDLDLRDEHLERLRAFLPGLGLPPAAGRQAAFDLLGGTAPQAVYFYCHGGLNLDAVEGSSSGVGTPYLRVGGPDEAVITSTNIRTKGFPWRWARPLIFINGCHTTALEPRRALEFVSAFVVDAFASGVIGTEITVYEPLATVFAEEFFRRFVGQGQPAGSAVRGARLALLGTGNPLGLAYVPFVPPDLRIMRVGT